MVTRVHAALACVILCESHLFRLVDSHHLFASSHSVQALSLTFPTILNPNTTIVLVLRSDRFELFVWCGPFDSVYRGS